MALAFALAAYWFWAFPYRCALSFHEQYQLFLTTGDYFIERTGVPGGFASWMAELLTQFYYKPVFGALVPAAMSVALQALTWLLAQVNGAKWAAYPLSFITPLALWAYMGDENVMLAFGLSLVAALGAMLLLSHNAHWCNCPLWIKATAVAVGLPVFHWLFGPSVLIVAAYVAFNERHGMRLHKLSSFIVAAMALIVTIACINACTLVVPFPLSRLYRGLEYYRYPVYDPSAQYAIMATATVLPLLMPLLRDSRRSLLVGLACLAASAYAAFHVMGFDRGKYDVIDYDFLVRTEQWEKIIGKAEHQQPETPLEVAALNLALSQKGQLAERLFDFYQNGTEGLLPSFSRNMTTPVFTGEAFFRLGMVNDAHRHFFEAQEAIPNFRKSGRLTKRIVECEMANGNFAVAAYYLRMMSNTLYYKPWAMRMMRMLKSPADVARHPLIRRMRACRYTKADYLFSDTEMDQMLGLLFTCNNGNCMAYEYLMCHTLLNRDVEKFMRYYPLGQHAGYSRIPRSFQEVLVGVWLQRHGNLRSMPYSVDAKTAGETVEFLRIYTSESDRHQLDLPPYCHNVWHYITKTSEE